MNTTLPTLESLTGAPLEKPQEGLPALADFETSDDKPTCHICACNYVVDNGAPCPVCHQ